MSNQRRRSMSIGFGCILSALLLGGVLSPAAPSGDADDDGTGNRPEAPTFGLVRGQALVGKPVEEHLTVLTSYGELKVPFKEIVRVRFRPRLSPADKERLELYLEALREDSGDEETLAAIRALGTGCYEALVEAAAAEENKSIQGVLEELVGELKGGDEVYLEPLDEVVSSRFTIKGHVLEDAIHVHRGALTLTIPRSDLRHIAYGELVVRKAWKVGPQHTEGSGGFLDTGHKVRKGQKFTLAPSGTMTWQGRSFGPEGISNHTWNSRKMGCLQWRIGASSAWTVLSGPFEGRASDSGPIQFCVHLTGGDTSGEFKVEFKMRKR